MWYGAALLFLWVAYVTAKDELPTYLGFLIPQGTATAPPAQTPAQIGTAAASTVPLMPGVPAAGGLPSQNLVPWSTIPGSIGGG